MYQCLKFSPSVPAISAYSHLTLSSENTHHAEVWRQIPESADLTCSPGYVWDCRHTRKCGKKLPQLQYNIFPSQPVHVLLHFSWSELDCYAVAKIWLQSAFFYKERNPKNEARLCTPEHWAAAWLPGLSCTLTFTFKHLHSCSFSKALDSLFTHHRSIYSTAQIMSPLRILCHSSKGLKAF